MEMDFNENIYSGNYIKLKIFIMEIKLNKLYLQWNLLRKRILYFG